MSSNITVNRICQHCGNEFVAKKTTTQYCSHRCNSAAYKLSVRNKKIEKSNRETEQIITNPIKTIQYKEFLSVKEAASLIGCTRQSIYKMINSGRLNATNILQKKTVIKREEINKMFHQTIPPKLKKVFNKDDFYYLEEIVVKFAISSKALYELLKRNNIEKTKKYPYVYVLKKDIHKIFGKPENEIN